MSGSKPGEHFHANSSTCKDQSNARNKSVVSVGDELRPGRHCSGAHSRVGTVACLQVVKLTERRVWRVVMATDQRRVSMLYWLACAMPHDVST